MWHHGQMSRSLPLTVVVALLSLACDDEGRTRDRGTPEIDAAPATDAGALEDAGAGGPDTGPGEPDATMSGDAGDAPVDAAPPSPDAEPPPPEVCDGDDDDGDGRIDEGVSNTCGGCGGLPPEGCQSWRINLTRDDNGEVDTRGVVSLQTGAIGFSERVVDNGVCEFVRLPAQHPDAHLGVVDVESDIAMARLLPTYDPDFGAHRYAADDGPRRRTLFRPGDTVEVRAGGGRSVGRFELSATAPPAIGGLAAEELMPVVLLARGETEGDVELAWDPEPGTGEPESGDTTLRFFVGGSLPIFTRGPYRAITSYSLDARLEDDGSFTLPGALFGQGVAESAIQVRLTRSVEQRELLGSHSVDLAVTEQVRVVLGGALDRDEPAPYAIEAPHPDDRTVVPGQPLPVRWSVWEAAEGPLTVTLTLTDLAALEVRQVRCRVDDPALGELIIPADVTEGWPSGEGDERLLSLGWEASRSDLPAPDRGQLRRLVTLLLRLEPSAQ
jgi:hypothetical protein